MEPLVSVGCWPTTIGRGNEEVHFGPRASPGVVLVVGAVVIGVGMARGDPIVAALGVAVVILGAVRFLIGSR
jgi:hypothetical protein